MTEPAKVGQVPRLARNALISAASERDALRNRIREAKWLLYKSLDGPTSAKDSRVLVMRAINILEGKE